MLGVYFYSDHKLIFFFLIKKMCNKNLPIMVKNLYEKIIF